MNALRFVQIAESYGHNSELWPQDERQQALDFAQQHPSALQLLERAKTLDLQLDSLTAPLPSDLLRARIMKAALTLNPSGVLRAANDRLPYRAIAATLIVSALAGFIGGGLPQSTGLETQLYAQAPINTTDEVALSSFDNALSYAWIEDSLTLDASFRLQD